MYLAVHLLILKRPHLLVSLCASITPIYFCVKVIFTFRACGQPARLAVLTCNLQHRRPSRKRDASQVGDIAMDDNGGALRGVRLRHLVTPGGSAGTRKIMRFISREVSTDTYVNIMDQYCPCGNAGKYPPLDRCITRDEYEDALRAARGKGIRRFDRQERRMRIIRRP